MKWVKAGFCLNVVSPKTNKSHLWIVLTDPDGDPPMVATVNLTSDMSDQTVVIEKGEHSFITKRTVVKYAAADIIDARRIERAIEKDPSLPHREQCSPELLEKLRRGIFASRRTPQKVKKFCRDKF